MSSSRLPGKVLKKINNKTLIERIIESSLKSKYSTKIYVATSKDRTDDTLVQNIKDFDVSIYRGSLENVYSRFYEIAINEIENFDSIVRLTADCPLLDTKIIDLTVESHYKNSNYDYSSTGLTDTFPLGQGVEVIEINKLNSPNNITLFIYWQTGVNYYKVVHIIHILI